MSMATYSSTITKVPDQASVPEDASSKPHHVHKHGAVVGFKNPHESYANGVGFGHILRTVVWYVALPYLAADALEGDGRRSRWTNG
jgi:hypothetical protein